MNLPALRSVLTAALVGALLSAALPSQAQEAAEAAPADLPAITVSEVRAMPMRDRVIASGLVAAVEEVRVQPQVEGQAVEDLLADVGDRVEAGQVLARLSGSTLDLQRSELLAQRASVMAAIAQSEANLIEATTAAAEAERVAARNATLLAQGTIAQAQADQTTAAADSARARVRVAEQGIASAQAQMALVDAQLASLDLQLSRTDVTAPAAGIVIERNASIGSIASGAGEPMFVLIRDGRLEMRADVSEADMIRLAPGQTALMTAPGIDTPIAGLVRRVSPTIDTQTRLGEARIEIEASDMIRAGMFLTAEILVRQEEMLAVPVTAVGAGAEGATVMVVRDGIVTRTAVVTGIRDGGMVGITEGLSAGDLVVTKAASFVRDGDRIRPVRDDAATVEQAAAAATEG